MSERPPPMDVKRSRRPSDDHTGQLPSPENVARVRTPVFRSASHSPSDAAARSEYATEVPSGERASRLYRPGGPTRPSSTPLRSNHVSADSRRTGPG